MTPGTVLAARYRLGRCIGRGGMGVVYEGTDLALGRRVAVKVLTETHPRSLERFRREAFATGALAHPNIVELLDVCTDGEPPFFVMELVEGTTWAYEIERSGRFSAERAVAVATQLLGALGAVHDLGIVHRDVKPENVILTRATGGADVVKVLDFGIAKLHRAGRATSTGLLVGTPAYMAPEQLRAEDVDCRTDIYAVGASLYCALSGTTPFARSNVHATMLAILSGGATPLRKLAPNAPSALVAAIERAMATDPAERFASAAEMLDALTPLLRPSWVPRAEERPSVDPFSTTLEAETTAIAPAPGHERRPRRLGPLGRAAPFLLALGVAALAAHGEGRARAPAAPASARAVAAVAAVAAACASDRACTERHGGAPHVCRAAGCVPLESTDCKLVAPEGAASDPRTFWMATMFPLSGEQAEVFGKHHTRAVTLAMRDFTEVTHGLPVRADAPPRPIGLVSCDDAVDARRAARHLVDLEVPAVIGFGSSKDLVDLAGSELIPHRMMAISSVNRSAMIRAVPHPEGEPRLVWRTTTSIAQQAEPLAQLLTEVLAPRIRAELGAVERPLRVAILRGDNTVSRGVADAFLRRASANGSAFVADAGALRDIALADDATAADHARAVRTLLDLRPDVVLYHPTAEGLARQVLTPLEQGWPANEKRPRYLVSWELNWPELLEFVGRSAERRARILGLAQTRAGVAREQLYVRYGSAFDATALKPSDMPALTYDAAYALLYAAYAADDATTGAGIAMAMPRLAGDGPAVDVGPEHILEALGALRGGGSIDLNGAGTRLDFDPASGEVDTDVAIVCMRPDRSGRAVDEIESGLTFETRTKRLVGALRCP